MAEQQIEIIITGNTDGLQKSTSKATDALNNVKKASGSAQYALTNLSRVASDAPFGFIAIQNNLEPLIGSFGALQKETGSAGGALKALASSLAGPAGIAVGFSVVSALVTTAIQKYGSLSAALEALFGNTDAAALAQRKLNEEFAKTDAGAKAQIGDLNSLIKIYDDVNTTETGRKEIMKKITEEYSKYLPNLDKEKITIGDIKANYDELSKTLITLGRIKALNKLIDDKTLETEQLRVAATSESVTALDQLKNTFTSLGNTVLTSAKNAAIGTVNQFKAIQEGEKITASYRKEVEKLEQSLANNKVLNTNNKTATNELTEAERKRAEELKRIENERLARLERVKIASEKITLKGLTVDIKTDKLGDITKLFGKGSNAVLDQITALQEGGQKVAETFNKIGESISGTLGPAFTQLFEDIFSGSQTAFQAFGQAIAGIIKKLIAAAVTAAILAVIIGAATGGMNFGAGAGAQTANFTAGFKALFGQLSGLKFADGGIVSGPTRALIGEAGPEAVIPLHKLDNMIGGNQNIFVTGVLSGENIYLQQQRTSARRSRFV